MWWGDCENYAVIGVPAQVSLHQEWRVFEKIEAREPETKNPEIVKRSTRFWKSVQQLQACLEAVKDLIKRSKKCQHKHYLPLTSIPAINDINMLLLSLTIRLVASVITRLVWLIWQTARGGTSDPACKRLVKTFKKPCHLADLANSEWRGPWYQHVCL